MGKFQGGRLFQCGRLLIFGKMQIAIQCFHMHFLNCSCIFLQFITLLLLLLLLFEAVACKIFY